MLRDECLQRMSGEVLASEDGPVLAGFAPALGAGDSATGISTAQAGRYQKFEGCKASLSILEQTSCPNDQAAPPAGEGDGDLCEAWEQQR